MKRRSIALLACCFALLADPGVGRAQGGLACLRTHLKKAFQLEKLKEFPSAQKYYRKALACSGAPTSQIRFARARLANFHLKANKCTACALYQLCQIKSMSVDALPATTSPLAKSLFQQVKAGGAKCGNKGAMDLQQGHFVLYKLDPATKKNQLTLSLKVIDLEIKQVSVIYTPPGSTKLLKRTQPCSPGKCSFTLQLKPPAKGIAPVLKYHYALETSSGSTNLHGKEGTRFERVLVSKKLYEKTSCADLKGTPHNPKSKPKAILSWLKVCPTHGLKKSGPPPWLWPVVAGVAGLLVGAAAGVIVTYVVLNPGTTTTP